MQACSCSIERTVHNNSQQPSTSKECIWKRKAKPNEKSYSPEELKIAKAEYAKATKQAIKPTTFYPTSLELDHLLFMDSLRAKLEETCAISSSDSVTSTDHSCSSN